MTRLVDSAGRFVLDNVPHKCGIKSALVEWAAGVRGLRTERLSRALVLVTTANETIPFYNLNGPDSSRIGEQICNRKNAQKAIAAARDLPVVKWAGFRPAAREAALKFAQRLGWPVVVKPARLSRARGVTPGIADELQFHRAWKSAVEAFGRRRTGREQILVEQHFHGEDFRFFVADNRVVSVTHRVRAGVVGDGESTIADLIEQKNAQRGENPYLRSYSIPRDIRRLDVLRASGRVLSDVPAAGEHVKLRSQSNLWAGGDSVDMTDVVAGDLAQLAIQAVAAIPGLPYAGVDIIAPRVDVFGPCVVSELEFSPAPMAHFPLHGIPRDMAGAVLDHYVGSV